MNVGVFVVFRRDPLPYVQAEVMIRSIRTYQHDAHVVQFTDETSPPVLGVDQVRRLPHGPMLQVRLQHYAACADEWLFVDSDVLLRRDISPVFEDKSFDVAVAKREWPHLAEESAALKAQGMPYNTGVVFSRSQAFWLQVLAEWIALPKEQQDWLSEQRTVAKVLATGRYRLRELPGGYNWPPGEGDLPPDVHIVHYKGARKDLMLEHAKGAGGGSPNPSAEMRTPLQAVPSLGVVPIFIGYDQRQPVAFHVAAHSIQTRASRPVAVVRLQLDQLPVKRRGLTEFTYSRFLVPWLCGFQGLSLFVDADILCRADVAELFALAAQQPEADVLVVKNPRRFEWASLMLFNNARCRRLTPDFVADATNGLLDLKWATSIGALPAGWNQLVGYDAPNPQAKLVHFTQGVPCWPETADSEHAQEWLRMAECLASTVPFAELMGQSVHVDHVKQRLADARA